MRLLIFVVLFFVLVFFAALGGAVVTPPGHPPIDWFGYLLCAGMAAWGALRGKKGEL